MDPLVPVGGELTLAGSEAKGPRVQRLDSRDAVVGIVITGENHGSTSGSGSGGGDSDVWTESPPKDLAKGKGPVVAEEASREVPMEQVEFTPAAGSSGHRPVTRGNFTEFVDEEVLACLLRENPTVVEAVLTAREERQRAVELAHEEERLRAKAEELVRETEAAERAQEDTTWTQESAVALAKARAQVERAEFVAETYTPSKPHVFVPSGFYSYVPRREDYDSELVLRDPTEYLSATWAEVYFQYLL